MKNKIPSSDITPEETYLSRRRFIRRFVTASAATLVSASCQRLLAESSPLNPGTTTTLTPLPVPTEEAFALVNAYDEMGNPVTDYKDITSYTNFYEFSTDKSSPTKLAENFPTDPWQVKIGGFVNNPLTLDSDDIRQLFSQQERVYRMRCVEGWSMVIPWNGFPLHELIKLVEPTSEAKFVRFETVLNPQKMPGQMSGMFPWPYKEGLRMDEAMHDLTLLATGIYGKALSPQNGAPIRLVVPWKYGFKSIKSIVKIDFVDEMPRSLWMASSPSEYGFYANVNPNVSHPRWSQATEIRIGQSGRIETLLFNGYQDEVEHLYKDMDLTIYF